MSQIREGVHWIERYLIAMMKMKHHVDVLVIETHPHISKCVRNALAHPATCYGTWGGVELQAECSVCAWNMKFHPMHPIDISVHNLTKLQYLKMDVAYVGKWKYVQAMLSNKKRNGAAAIQVQCGCVPVVQPARHIF